MTDDAIATVKPFRLEPSPRPSCPTCNGKGWVALGCGGADACLDCIPLRTVARLVDERLERIEAVSRARATSKVSRRVFRALASHPRFARAFA